MRISLRFLDELGSGRWYLPGKNYLFCLACAIERLRCSSGMTEVCFMPLRDFLESV